MDLLRLYGPGLVGLIIGCGMLLVAAWAVYKYVPKDVFDDKARKIGKKVVGFLITVIVIFYALSLVSSLSTNVTPRGVIDRSQTLDQQKAFEQRHSQKGVGL